MTPNTKTEKQADSLWKNNNSALGLAISPSLYELKFSSYAVFGVQDLDEIPVYFTSLDMWN